jgi:hypothetical protein
VYAFLVERVEDRDKFEFQLDQPLPGEARRQPSAKQVEQELQAFAALGALVGRSATIPGNTGGE